MRDIAGLRVLVVEDEGPLALMIEDMLEELGCTVVASVGQLDRACEVAETAQIELALLDVNLHGQPVFPVAQILRGRNIPVMFCTGYGAGGLLPEFSGCVAIGKPFSQLELQQGIESAMSAGTASGGSGEPHPGAKA